MSKSIFKLFVLVMFVLTGAVVSFAEEMEAKDAAAKVETIDAGAKMEGVDHAAMKGMDTANMTEEEKAMHARMQEFTTPNENHKLLESFTGNWKTNLKFWMDPKGEAMESEGASEAKMVMNGRYVEQSYVGTAMGQPYEGRGLIGYDNMRKEYTSIWFDNMGTGIMSSAAQYNAETKTFAEEGSMSCPMTNETHRKMRGVTTFIDADNYTYETFMKDKEGNEFRSMLITYTRSK